MITQKMLLLGWEVSIRLWYSSDIAPLDFQLFPSLQIPLMEKISPMGKSFLEDYKWHLEQFFAQKRESFQTMQCLMNMADELMS